MLNYNLASYHPLCPQIREEAKRTNALGIKMEWERKSGGHRAENLPPLLDHETLPGRQDLSFTHLCTSLPVNQLYAF